MSYSCYNIPTADFERLFQLNAEECGYRGLFYSPVWFYYLAQTQYQYQETAALVANENRELVAYLPYKMSYQSICGLSLKVFQSLSSEHSCRYDLVCRREKEAEVAQVFSRFLANDLSIDLVELDYIPENAAAIGVLKALESKGWHVIESESLVSPYIDLVANPTSPQGRPAIHKKYHDKLQKKLHKLQAKGELVLEVNAIPEEKDFQDFLFLEAQAWKGQAGSSIDSNRRVKELYQSAFIDNNVGSLLFNLKFKQQTIASGLGFQSADQLFMHKIAYDSSVAEFSPGQFFFYYVLIWAKAKQIGRFDFLGQVSEWKLKWTENVLRHKKYMLFAPNSAATLAYYARYKIPRYLRGVWRGKFCSPAKLAKAP